MHLHTPCLVLVPDTFLSASDNSAARSGRNPDNTSLLVQCIQEEFPFVPVEPVLRKYWNEDAGDAYIVLLPCEILIIIGIGLTFVSQLCVEDDERAATLVAASKKCIYALI